MATYINRDGEHVNIERNEDGSFTVTGEKGESSTYGAGSAEHIANDWQIDFGSPLNDPLFAPDVGTSGEGGRTAVTRVVVPRAVVSRAVVSRAVVNRAVGTQAVVTQAVWIRTVATKTWISRRIAARVSGRRTRAGPLCEWRNNLNDGSPAIASGYSRSNTGRRRTHKTDRQWTLEFL